MASLVTAHVLDAALGRPAAGITVALETADGTVLGEEATNDDGRVPSLGPETLPPGMYRLRFGTGAYFAAAARDTFFPEVTVTVTIGFERHYHVPLLLSPYSYTTYRGS